LNVFFPELLLLFGVVQEGNSWWEIKRLQLLCLGSSARLHFHLTL
jgi:hypothetical protein